jgi:hypothetical protein
VKWNGSALATKFISGSQLMATVLAADVAEAGTGKRWRYPLGTAN